MLASLVVRPDVGNTGSDRTVVHVVMRVVFELYDACYQDLGKPRLPS